jgi:hypothetical protein
MSTPEPPPYPGDTGPEGSNDLPSYGSVQPPSEPPQAGGPPGGSVPPPPPPPPPPGAPPEPPGPTGSFSPPDAIAWGWRKFTENVGPILIAALVAVAITVLVGIVGSIITALLGGGPMGDVNNMRTQFEMGFGDQTGGWADVPAQILQSVVGTALGAVFAKAALDVADGQPFNLFAAFGKINFVNVIVLSLIVGAATVVGLFLCVLPGLAVMFLTYLSTYALVDGDGQSPIDAIKTSVRLISANLAESFLLALLNVLVIIAGVIARCVGLFVALPVTVLATAYAYRAFSGRPVAA